MEIGRWRKMPERRSLVTCVIFFILGAMIYGTVYGYHADGRRSSSWESLPHKIANKTTLPTTHADVFVTVLPSTTVSPRSTRRSPTTQQMLLQTTILPPKSPEELVMTRLANFNCSVPEVSPLDVGIPKGNGSFCYAPHHPLKCFQDPLNCSDFQINDDRELSWPAFGEYTFLSHQRWVKVLQHGGVVFLYHPCTKPSLVTELRQLTEECLRRFVLTPTLKLTRAKPVALVTWGCYMLMDTLNSTLSKEWIKMHAFRAPASHIHESGTFKRQLLKPAKVVTDFKDSLLCPEEEEAMLFTEAPAKVEKMRTSHPGEELILKRLSLARHDKNPVHNYNVTLTRVDVGNAAWALASLVFLCGLLLGLMIYTQLIKTPSIRRYRSMDDGDSDDDVGTTGRRRRGLTSSLIKSSQAFINSFRTKRQHRLETMGKLKLLTPITEDSEEEL